VSIEPLALANYCSDPTATSFSAGKTDRFAANVAVQADLAYLQKPRFRIVVSADLDNLGGHSHRPHHHTSSRLLCRHEHADP
jgi:hypothetical protein